MRVLAILYCYPPLLVPAAICYLKLVSGLERNGVEVEIVTIAPDSFLAPGPAPMDPGLRSIVSPRTTNHVVRSPERSLLIRAMKRLDPARRVTRRWLEPKKLEWTRPALQHLLRQDLDRYDLILSCSQPHANHLLGLELKRRTGKPWVAYFSDPWTDNPYASFASQKVRDYNRQLEDEVLRKADLVLYTCDEMQGLVQSKHTDLDPERVDVLPHAFVPEWYGLEDADPVESRAAVRILQTGSFYGPRTPLPLLDALQKVGSGTSLEGRLRIDTYGGMDPRHAAAITERGLDRTIGAHGFAPYLQTLSLMKKHDALLLVDAPLTSTSESVFLPSKLVDYLGAGTLVVAATPERGATARVVREAGGVVCALERPEELERFLLETVDSGRVAEMRHPEVARSYDVQRVGRRLVELLEKVKP